MASEPTTFDEAARVARQYVADIEHYLDRSFVQPTLQQLLDQLAAGEQEALMARDRLVQMREAGIAGPADYALFEKVRIDLFSAQVRVYRVVVTLVNHYDPTGLIAPKIPQPKIIPIVLPQPLPTDGLRGLGEPVTITVSIGVAIAALLVATAVGFLLAYFLLGVTNDLAGVFIARARAQQYVDMADRRLQVYRECMQTEGATPEHCAQVAGATIPTPEESGTDIPPAEAPTSPITWIAVGMASTVALGSLLTLAYYWAKSSLPARALRASGVTGVPVRNVAALPSRAPDLDGSKSTYNLEIGLGGARKKRRRKKRKAA